MTSLRVEGLRKSYGQLEVLRGVELTIEAGSLTAILGPSGSGKSTLLRIVAGFERADEGCVEISGEICDDAHHFVPPERRRIGYVTQEGNLFPHLTVEQNVAFGLPRSERLHRHRHREPDSAVARLVEGRGQAFRGGEGSGRKRHGTHVASLLSMVGLGGSERRYPHQLSGGQQQRVALARALAINPNLVLLDEPFSALDASLRESVRRDVRRVLREAGTTGLLVTHDQDEALSLADHVAVIAHGEIGQFDTPQGLYAHPNSPELARSLGDANLLTGIARDGRVDTSLGPLGFASTGHGDGEALVVLVRPEQLMLVAAPSKDAPSASVVDTSYFGHDAVVRLRADFDPTIVLTARVVGGTDLAVGDRVGLVVRGDVLGWRADSLSEHRT